jgi:L-arabinose isomerase
MFLIALESTDQLISGHPKEQEVWDEIRDCIDAARAVSVMRMNRVGVLGHLLLWNVGYLQ